MTVFEVEGGSRLEVPEEPVEIRVALRDAVLGGQDWRDGFSDDVCLAVWLWQRWQPTLEPCGFSREEFVDAVVGYRREIWLWLMGERKWLPLVTGLAGRVLRRVPTPIA